MHVKVKFGEGFKDGNIFPNKPKGFAPGEFAILSEQQVAQVASSGGTFEVVENVIPNPKKAQKELDETQPLPLHDPLNADNSINDLENHIPGTEELIEEQRIMQEALRERREEKARKAESGEEPVLGFSNPEEREAQERKEEVEEQQRQAELQRQQDQLAHEAGQRGEAGEEYLNAESEVDVSGQARQEPREGDPQSELSDMLTQEQKDSIKPERASRRTKPNKKKG